MKAVEIFCPATIANVSCGFDVLGLCIAEVGDRMVVRRANHSELRITKIEGANLSMDINENVAGVSAQALLQHLGHRGGFDIEIVKHIKTGSGIGSSAASSAGAVFAINHLLGSPLTTTELIPFAMKGEGLSCGSEHADNVAPALLGGFTLVRNSHPLDIIRLPIPLELYVTVIHPQIEIRTADARAVLKKQILLKDAVTQWGNLAAFVSALHTSDYELLSRSMTDVVIEPTRSILIPSYNKVKIAALSVGALGSGISGSGPSIFALSKGRAIAEKVKDAIIKVYQSTNIDYDIHLSNIATQGIKVLKTT